MFSQIITAAAMLGAASAGRINPRGTFPTSTYEPYPSYTPTPTPGPSNNTAFNILSLRSASPVHFLEFEASQGFLFLDLPNQGADCTNGASPNYATFYIEDSQLFLYSRTGEVQQIFTDRSGMGQGVTGYITGEEMAPRNAELKGWKVDEYGDLSFEGADFLACPHSIDDSWSLWIDVGNSNPGGNSGCLGISARTSKNTKPPSCEYSQ